MEGKGLAFTSICAKILTIEYVMIWTMSALLKLINHEVQHSCSAPGIDLQILRLNVSMNLRRELCILDDISCNLLREASTHNSSYLTNIFYIYGLSQLIYTEPTRFTPVSETLINLFIIIHWFENNFLLVGDLKQCSDPNDMWQGYGNRCWLAGWTNTHHAN